jgi:hypothetical protein
MNYFKLLRFPDVPVVEKRYILCSKAVPVAVVKKLNEAIKATIHLK